MLPTPQSNSLNYWRDHIFKKWQKTDCIHKTYKNSAKLFLIYHPFPSKSSSIVRAAFRPEAPIIPPPGWVLAPVKYNPFKCVL